MIKRCDFVGLRHVGKKLQSFDYVIPYGEDNKEAIAHFSCGSNACEFVVSLTVNGVPTMLGVEYAYTYKMPKSGLAMELVAATGLRYVQAALVNELQDKSDVIMMIGIKTEGM